MLPQKCTNFTLLWHDFTKRHGDTDIFASQSCGSTSIDLSKKAIVSAACFDSHHPSTILLVTCDILWTIYKDSKITEGQHVEIWRCRKNMEPSKRSLQDRNHDELIHLIRVSVVWLSPSGHGYDTHTCENLRRRKFPCDMIRYEIVSTICSLFGTVNILIYYCTEEIHTVHKCHMNSRRNRCKVTARKIATEALWKRRESDRGK